MIHKEIYEKIKQSRELRLSGELTSIPFPSLPKLNKTIPGTEKASYVQATANSKVGKTQIVDFMYVIEPINCLLLDLPVDFEIIYFSLEVSKYRKFLQFMSYALYKFKNVRKSTRNLESKFKDSILEEEVLKHINSPEIQHYFELLEKHVTIIDSIRNPYGIYKYVRDKAHKEGYYIDKNGVKLDISKIERGDLTEIEKIHKYVSYFPKKTVIVVVDNFNLLTPEVIDGTKETLREAMNRFSSRYCLQMRDRWEYTPIGIIQQSPDSEKQQFTFRGDTIIQKLKPSADGLGDSKAVARDCNLLLGLFSPVRYDIGTYNNYDIGKLKDNYREFSIIFDREGTSLTKELDLFFDGAVNVFKELPDPTNTIEMDKFYQHALKIQRC